MKLFSIICHIKVRILSLFLNKIRGQWFEEVDDKINDAIDKLNSQYCYNHVKWALSHKASDSEIQRHRLCQATLEYAIEEILNQTEWTDHNISVYQWLCHYRKMGKDSKDMMQIMKNGIKWTPFEQNLDSIDDFETKVNSILVDGGSEKIAELYDMNAVNYFEKWIENYRDDLNFRHVNNQGKT